MERAADKPAYCSPCVTDSAAREVEKSHQPPIYFAERVYHFTARVPELDNGMRGRVIGSLALEYRDRCSDVLGRQSPLDKSILENGDIVIRVATILSKNETPRESLVDLIVTAPIIFR